MRPHLLHREMEPESLFLSWNVFKIVPRLFKNGRVKRRHVKTRYVEEKPWKQTEGLGPSHFRILAQRKFEPSHFRNFMFLSTEEEALPWEIRVKIAIGTAQGLAFLHSIKNSPLHLELRMHNIMLDEQYNAKLFYLESNKQCLVDDTFVIVGKAKYISPEFIISGRLRKEADVYTFGVILLDLLTNLEVRTGSLSPLNYKIGEIIDPRLGSDYLANAVTQMCTLIQRCTMLDTKKRPLMQQVLDVLNDIAEIKD